MQSNNDSLYGITMHKSSDYRLKLSVDGVSLDNLMVAFEVEINGVTYKFDRFASVEGSDIYIMVPFANIKRINGTQGRYTIYMYSGANQDVVLYGNVKVML